MDFLAFLARPVCVVPWYGFGLGAEAVGFVFAFRMDWPFGHGGVEARNFVTRQGPHVFTRHQGPRLAGID